MGAKDQTNSIVSEIMHKNITSVKATTSAQGCAKKMTKERVGCIIVLDNKDPVGIITERGFADLVKKGNFDCKEVQAQDFMTKPLITIKSTSSYMTAMRKFEKEDIKRMPVVDKTGVIGLLTLKNLVSHSKKSMNKLQRENNLLKKMAEQRGMTRE
tara:strand:+ start:101 stop:568 length:468 start_codon:yes stop_codon:yes gene_type:complete